MANLGNLILQKNLSALKRRQAVLSSLLGESNDLIDHLVETPDGSFSVRANGEEGPWVGSRRAPKREADRLMQGLEVKNLQPIVLVGIGNGDLLKRLCDNYDTSPVVVLEDRLPLIRTVLSKRNFVDEIAGQQLTFGLELAGQPFNDAIRNGADTINVYGFSRLEHAYTRNDIRYQALFKRLANWTKERALELSSEFWGARRNLENLLGNIPHYLESPGIESLKDTLKGMPAVLIGAGPSLQRNLHVLKEWQDNVVIMPVSSALKRVHGAGIRADATNVVDYSHLSQRYFKNMKDCPPLIAHPRAHPSTLDAYEGPKLLVDDTIYEGIFTDQIERRGSFGSQGNNVAHYAFHALRFLGCSPIMLMGLDLGFTAHTTHTPGTAIHDEWVTSISRFSSLEAMELAHLHVHRHGPILVKDIHGHEIHTDNLMRSAGDLFENIINKLGANETTINCTEGGRALEGVRNMTLEDALKEYAPRPLDFSGYRKALQRSEEAISRDLEKGADILKRAERFSEKMGGIFKSAVKALKRAMKRLDDGISEDEETAQRLDKLNEKLNEWRGIYHCVTELGASDRMIRQKRKSEIADTSRSENERLRILAEGESEYMESLQEALETWNDILDNARRRLDAYVAKRSELMEASQ